MTSLCLTAAFKLCTCTFCTLLATTCPPISELKVTSEGTQDLYPELYFQWLCLMPDPQGKKGSGCRLSGLRGSQKIDSGLPAHLLLQPDCCGRRPARRARRRCFGYHAGYQ